MKDKAIEIIKNKVSKDKYSRGLYLSRERKLENTYSNLGQGEYMFYGSCKDDITNTINTSMINIDLKNNYIKEYSCDCVTVLSKNKEICSHIVAVVLYEINKKERADRSIYKEVSLDLQIDGIDNEFILAKLNCTGINESEFKQVLHSYKNNKKLYLLDDKNHIDLSNINITKVLDMIILFNIEDDFSNIKIPINKIHYIQELKNENLIQNSNKIQNILNKLKCLDSKLIEEPKGLNTTLKHYQIEGLNFLNNMSKLNLGVILADEMGLGKTVQVISFLLANEGKKSIIITPTSLLFNWMSEIKKFAPSLKVGLYYKNGKEEVIEKINDYDIILTTYQTYKNDCDKYKSNKFDYCIIDEAQMIKNPNAQITKAIKAIKADFKVALTGTPIENNLIELWSIFDFINPNYLYKKEDFSKIFIDRDQNIKNLKKLIAPFILRRLKKDVLKELPNKIETKYFVELNNLHKNAYNSFTNLVKIKIKEDNQSINTLNYLTKLRQLCLVPELMVKNHKIDNSKLNVLVSLLKEHKDEKILVFSQFTKVLDVIGKRLLQEKISYEYLDGKTSPRDRIKKVNEFNEKNENKVFLISLKAGGSGLNLTSASIVIHFDPWFNPSVENQASDRAHRIGQDKIVNVIKLISIDTIEEKIVLLQESKQELITNVLDNNDNMNKSLKNIDIDELISVI